MEVFEEIDSEPSFFTRLFLAVPLSVWVGGAVVTGGLALGKDLVVKGRAGRLFWNAVFGAVGAALLVLFLMAMLVPYFEGMGRIGG